MGNPEVKTATSPKGEPTYEQRVNEVVGKMTEKEDGTWELPEDTPEDLKYAATLEKRRRDTQAGFTKTSQKVKALEIEKNALAEKLSELASQSFKLSEDQREELEDLKIANPDAWREKLNQYETQAQDAMAAILTETQDKADLASEKERRRIILAEFNQEHGDLITDGVLANDVPPRFTKALDEGTVSFEEFLGNVKTYLETPKQVTNGSEVKKQPNLNNQGGGSTVSKGAADKDAVASYDKTTF